MDHLQIAQGYSWLEDYPKLKTTYDRALASFTPGGAWARTQADPQNVADTSKKIEKQLREHAIFLNGKAQKDKTSQAEFEGAASLYDAYLSKFSTEPKAFQIEYYLAEIDFRRLGKNTEAATHYMNAARGMPTEVDSTAPGDPLHRHDAVYNAIASLERVRVAELEARKSKGGGAETETDKKFADALALFQQLYPSDPKIPDLLYRDGKLYYDYGMPAIPMGEALGHPARVQYPRDPNTGKAGELIIDSFVKAKNFENTETWATELKSPPAFADRVHQTKLEELIVQSMFKQGEQKATANDRAGILRRTCAPPRSIRRTRVQRRPPLSAETKAKLASDVESLKEAATLVTGKDYRDKPESPM